MGEMGDTCKISDDKLKRRIVYCIPSTQLYECITTNCLLKLKMTTCFGPLCGHHQVNTGTYMCILNCKRLPNIWAHIYN
jgi:hypothetical protein